MQRATQTTNAHPERKTSIAEKVITTPQEAICCIRAINHTDYAFPSPPGQVMCMTMKALVYDIRPMGWLTCKWLRHLWRGCLLSGVNGLGVRDLPAPALPGRDWVRVRTLLGGICGTDLALIAQKQAPDSILQAFSSMPIMLGHENVAIVEELGPDVEPHWLNRR